MMATGGFWFRLLAAISLLQACVGQRVAIIGTGIGGSAAAYYIKQVIGDANITAFERDDRVGGRAEAIVINDTVLEIGASILYTGNLHLKEAAEQLGLTSRDPPHMGGTFGVWDGEKLLYRSREFKPFTLITMLWRYRRSLLRLLGVVRGALDQFMTIYDLQKTCTGFESPKELWSALGLLNLTQVSMRDYLREEGVGEADSKIVGELVGAVNKVNYNQDNGLNALAGVVSLCPMVTGSVFSIAEGNAALATAMLNHSHATLHISSPVGTIEVLDGDKPQYRLHAPGAYNKPPPSDSTETAGSNDVDLGVFDVVVVATPLVSAGLTIVGDDGTSTPLKAPPLHMQTTISTFVEGSLREGVFGKPRTPASIYLKENTSWPFSSLSRQVGLNATHAVYKLFSSTPVQPTYLETLFSSYRVLDTRDWKAYPHFHPPEDIPSFVLKPGHRIYYVKALEAAVSAMEVSAIAAKNIALLLGESYGVCARPAPPTSPRQDL